MMKCRGNLSTSPTRTLRALASPLAVQPQSSANVYLDFMGSVQDFRKNLEIKIKDLESTDFDLRGQTLMETQQMYNRLATWLNQSNGTDTLDLTASDYQDIKAWIESQGRDLPGLFEQGAWLADVKALKLDQVNTLMNTLDDFSMQLIQNPVSRSLIFQGHLQSLSQSYTLLNQIQSMMNDLLKTMIQSIRA